MKVTMNNAHLQVDPGDERSDRNHASEIGQNVFLTDTSGREIDIGFWHETGDNEPCPPSKSSRHPSQNGISSVSNDRKDASQRNSFSMRTENSSTGYPDETVARSQCCSKATHNDDVIEGYCHDVMTSVINGVTSSDGEQGNYVPRKPAMSTTWSPKTEDKKKSLTYDAKSKKVGQYLLGSTLGEGSYGKVRIATHLISKQQVAIKVVAKKLLVLHEAARRHFRREALLLRHVSHPSVIKLYEAMETSNSYYLAFELATGGHLLDYVAERGKLTEDENRRFMRQMVSAVDHLHKSGIVHRDLKLENFLLGGENNIKLADFSLSAICPDAAHHLNTQCGSPVYAAPELFAGRKYGKPVDVWSLGVCLFAMLVGRLPFLPTDETSLLQLYSLILRGCVPPAYLSDSCQTLIKRMLELEETQRITVEEMLSHHWLLGPDNQPIKCYPVVPKKVSGNTVNHSIVKYMCTMFRFSESDVITSVIERKLTASAATHNILKDSIEAGHVTLMCPREWSSIERGQPSKKSSRRHSRTDDSPVNSSDSTLNGGLGNSSSTSQKHPLSTDEVEKEIPHKEESQSQTSYRESLLVLKQTRQRLHHPVSFSDQRLSNGGYLVVGRSPRNTNSHTRGNDVTGTPTSSASDSSSHMTFPPISSANSGSGSSVRRSFGSGIQGNGHFIHRKRVADLGVKGVSSNLTDRSVSSNVNALGMYRQMHPTIPIHSLNSPFFSDQRTPPPPPPNSSHGTHPVHSRSSSHHDHRQGGSSDMRDRHPHFQENSNHPYYAEVVNKSEDVYVHHRENHKILKDAPRPSLAALRDPFGRDTWSKSRAERQNRKLKQLSGRTENVQRDHGLNSEDSSKSSRCVSLLHKVKTNIKSEHTTTGLSVGASSNLPSCIKRQSSHQDPDCVFHNQTEGGLMAPGGLKPYSSYHDESPRPGSQSPGCNRAETDSPLSQTQEKEDYLTPVTRVTITAIGRH